MRIGEKNIRVTLDEFRPVLVAMLVLAVIFAFIKEGWNSAAEPVTLSNVPSYSTEFENERFYSVDTLVELGERIYILPGRGRGFVQVFDLDGTYQYSMFFLDHDNGGFSLGTDGEYVYVRDKRCNIYVFLNDAFLKYERREEAEERPAQIWESTPGYEIRGQDLWHASDGCEELVIQNLIASRTGEYIELLGYFLPIGILWLIASHLKRRRMS